MAAGPKRPNKTVSFFVVEPEEILGELVFNIYQVVQAVVPTFNARFMSFCDFTSYF